MSHPHYRTAGYSSGWYLFDCLFVITWWTSEYCCKKNKNKKIFVQACMHPYKQHLITSVRNGAQHENYLYKQSIRYWKYSNLLVKVRAPALIELLICGCVLSVIMLWFMLFQTCYLKIYNRNYSQKEMFANFANLGTFVNIVLIAESFKAQRSRTMDQSNIQNFRVTRFYFWKNQTRFYFGKTKTVEINDVINRLQMGMSTILHSFYSKMMD